MKNSKIKMKIESLQQDASMKMDEIRLMADDDDLDIFKISQLCAFESFNENRTNRTL